jgi:Zn-dependent M28 family amino/carboxypeptidase
MRKIYIFILFIFIFSGCKQTSQSSNQKVAEQIKVPVFVADSAYQFIQSQVDFGPRVPNTDAHAQCAAYLSAKLKSFGAEVTEQKADLKAFNGTVLKAVNIIGSFQPEKQKRVLLFAHWDTRPWSDHDPDSANHNTPVLGANDGASGVGVLLEIARQLGQNAPEVGVDIIFFDAEDYGAPETFSGNSEDSWCLGSQYWSKNPHKNGYKADYGILLDMVGAPGATFYKEEISMYYAAHVVNKVWDIAQNLGYGQYFLNEKMGAITDDHLYVNRIAGIPSIDIIQYDKFAAKGFGQYWHTTHDTMENIDKATLNAVGNTLMHVLFQ